MQSARHVDETLGSFLKPPLDCAILHRLRPVRDAPAVLSAGLGAERGGEAGLAGATVPDGKRIPSPTDGLPRTPPGRSGRRLAPRGCPSTAAPSRKRRSPGVPRLPEPPRARNPPGPPLEWHQNATIRGLPSPSGNCSPSVPQAGFHQREMPLRLPPKHPGWHSPLEPEGRRLTPRFAPDGEPPRSVFGGTQNGPRAVVTQCPWEKPLPAMAGTSLRH